MIYYSNSEFRSILNGLGYTSCFEYDESDFPLSSDNSSLTDKRTVEAIKQFQREYNLVDDGIVGDKTTTVANTEMNTVHIELNILLDTKLPINQPVYGPQTVKAVKEFQELINVSQDGIANHSVRVQLYAMAQQLLNSNREHYQGQKSYQIA